MLHLPLLHYNEETAFISRAAAIQICRGINFGIVSAVVRDLRARNAAVPLETEAQDGSIEARTLSIDDANTEIADEQAAAEEQRVREEQGFAVEIPPMELAAKLKVIRDALAVQLLNHARLISNPNDPHGKQMLNRYDLAPPLAGELDRQLSRSPTVNMAAAEAEAQALDLPVEDIVRVRRAQLEQTMRFLKNNREEILAGIESLRAYNVEGHEYTIHEAEQVEETLPAIQRARFYVDADRGLFYERDRWINALRRHHPDAAGSMKLIDAARKTLHDSFNMFMRKADIKRDIGEAILRGATMPTLLPMGQTASQSVATKEAEELLAAQRRFKEAQQRSVAGMR